MGRVDAQYVMGIFGRTSSTGWPIVRRGNGRQAAVHLRLASYLVAGVNADVGEGAVLRMERQ